MRTPRAAVLGVLRRYERELVCGRCRGVVAWIRLRPFSLVRPTDRDGHDVSPPEGTVATGIVRTRLADAERALETATGSGADERADVARARADAAHLQRAAGELVHELTCPTCRTRHLRSLPALTRAVRRSPTGRVPLR